MPSRSGATHQWASRRPVTRWRQLPGDTVALVGLASGFSIGLALIRL
ncbi:hypothetical protein [Streptomyces syringium]